LKSQERILFIKCFAVVNDEEYLALEFFGESFELL